MRYKAIGELMRGRTESIDRGTNNLYTFRDCQNWLERLAQGNELAAVAELVATIGARNIEFLKIYDEKTGATPWDIGLAMLLCLTSNATGSVGADLNNVSTELLLKVQDLTVDDWFSYPEGSLALKSSRMLRLVETQVSQPTLRLSPLLEISRTRILLGLDGFRNLPADPAEEANRLLQSSYGYGAEEIFSAGIALWFYGAIGNSMLRISEFVNGTTNPRKHAALMRAYLERHAVEKERVAVVYSRLASKGRVEGLAAEFFTNYPAIKMASDTYLLAPNAYLADTVSMGLLRRTCEQAESEAGCTDTPFRGWLGGERFEPYVGELLREYCGESVTHPQYEYLVGTNSKSSDWIVFQSEDDVIFFECKIRNLSPGTLFGYDWSAVTTDLDNKLAKFFRQIIKWLHALHDGENKRILHPEHAALSRRIILARRWHLVVIFPQIPSIYHLHGGPGRLRKAIESGFSPIETAAKASWHDWKEQKIASMTPMSCSDLEILLSHGIGSKIGATLRAYGRQLESEDPVTEVGFSDSLRNYLLRSHYNAERPGHIQLLSDGFNRAMNAVASEWFGCEAADRLRKRRTRHDESSNG